MVSSSWSPTITPGSERPCVRFWRRRLTSAATCIFSEMHYYVPRKVDDDCLQELRWLYDRRDLIEARRDLAAWLTKWSSKYSKLTGWVEDNIDETLTFYRLPRQHHKHLKSTNMLERLNEEIKRRTHVVRIFPRHCIGANADSSVGRVFGQAAAFDRLGWQGCDTIFVRSTPVKR